MERECIELNMWRVAEAAGAVPVAIELDHGTAHAAGITLNGVWRRGSERFGNFEKWMAELLGKGLGC